MLNESTNSFINIGLSIASGAPHPPAIKNSMRGGSTAQAEVKTGLRQLLKTRELTTLDWLHMTGVEFDSEDHLYDYVQKVYEHVFCGAEEFPELPED
jgi:hypothetical protein